MNSTKLTDQLRHDKDAHSKLKWRIAYWVVLPTIIWFSLGLTNLNPAPANILNQSQSLSLTENSSQLPEQIQSLKSELTTAEWLGPLAPVALSPFFGQAMLFGMASFGPDWLRERSRLIAEDGQFDNPVLFFVFAVLAVFTSLPRFTKVSKPIGLVAENLEAYSAIIAFVVIRFLMSAGTSSVDPLDPVAAGFPELTLDVIMCIAAGLNIIVINLVKFFIELLVWLIPIPLVDAILESTNKLTCAALMGLYCYSPLLATLLNLALFTISAIVYTKVVRRLRYYRSLIIGPILAYMWPSKFAETGDSMTAFAIRGFKSLPACSKVKLTKINETRVLVSGTSLWRREVVELEIVHDETKPGIVVQRRELTTKEGEKYTFGHRRLVEQTAPSPAVA